MERSRSIALWLVLLIVFLDWLGLGLVYPMFSSMLFHPDCPFVDIGTSESVRGWYLGLLLASMSIAQFLSGPVFGALSDQKGRRPIFVFTLALSVVGYICCMMAVKMGSLAFLVVSRVIVGAAAGNAAVVSASVADLSNLEDKTKNFGLYSMACGVGFSVGPFLGGKFSAYGYSVPFLVAGIATFLNFLLIFFFYRETNENIKKGVPLRFDKGIQNLKKAYQVPGLRVLFLSILVYCFGWSFYYEFLPVTWIADHQFDVERIGFFFAYAAGCFAISAGFLIRPIINRFRHEAIFFYALCLLGAFLLMMLLNTSILWIWIGLPISNFFAALLFPTSTTLVSNWAKKDAQGETLGILQSVQAAAFALSPLAAGSFLGSHPHMPMVLGGFAMLLAALIMGIFLRKKIFV